MKKYLLNSLLILILALVNTVSFAQEEQQQEEKKDKPVREPFAAATIIENQTTIMTATKRLELMIQHRMGSIDNGLEDLYGIYGASNIRMGLKYGITDKITVGIGTEKNNKLTDINGKYLVLRQTRKNTIPVSVAVYANASYDGRDEDFFGTDYEFMDRFSYFGQIIVGRKFTDKLSVQVAPSFSHINAVDREYHNDKIGVMAGGRFKFTETMAVIGEYHQPISINPQHDYQKDIEAGAAFGLEIATITHAFQVFISNYNEIVAQKNYVMNTRKLDSEGICIGFNVNVRF